MAQVVRSIKFDKNQKEIKKEKMIKSISFKEKERELWEHLNAQLDSTYYIKYLILKDMQDVSKEENYSNPNATKNETQNSNNNANSNSDEYLNLDF